jgi:ADP-ribose pyrophosphatase
VREIYNGRVVRLIVESFELPNGKAATIEMIRHPGAAAVVPLTEERDVLLIHQYRRAASGFIYEVPAGKLDPGEEPEHCAMRELEEEAGVRAGKLQALGSIFTTPGFTDEIIHLYLATSLEAVRQKLDDDEVLSVERVSFERALEMCMRGELRDAKSICALMLADRVLRG